MVKVLLVFFFCVLTLYADFSIQGEQNTPLAQKIQSFVSPSAYEKNKKFIKLIFLPESHYYTQEKVDVVKVVQTLKENGLLNLFFKEPKELQLSFTTSGSPLFFVKIMGDTLRNIGYYRYVTAQSNLDDSEFTWTIVLTAEYATDPLILQKELAKKGCSILDIVKKSQTNWHYSINMDDAYLNIPVLENGVKFTLKRSLYAHWLNVSHIEKLSIKSSHRDDWYPHITYYDKQLNLLEVKQKDRKTRRISLAIPRGAKYIKISDIYTLKNIKANLILEPSGLR